MRCNKIYYNAHFLVIQAGFEPTTRSLEGCCSIQLSYWTVFPFFYGRKDKQNILLTKSKLPNPYMPAMLTGFFLLLPVSFFVFFIKKIKQ